MHGKRGPSQESTRMHNCALVETKPCKGLVNLLLLLGRRRHPEERPHRWRRPKGDILHIRVLLYTQDTWNKLGLLAGYYEMRRLPTTGSRVPVVAL